MAESLAVQAYQQQNLNETKPENTRFPCHDTFQNGIVKNGAPTTFYTAATDRDIENIRNHNSDMSGFLTDESTVNSCKDSKGIFDANDYADKTQTQPWRPADALPGTDYTYRENIAAFDVNWEALNDSKNADLKDRLCDSEGNLKCAFGMVEENTHWGEGGGNQYYINKADFNEAINREIFQYNENKTLRECNGTLKRYGISEKEMNLMNFERQENIKSTLSLHQEKNASTDVEKAKSLNKITAEQENKINSDIAPKGNYIASPDPAYKYNQNSNRDIDLQADLGLTGAATDTIASGQAMSGIGIT